MEKKLIFASVIVIAILLFGLFSFTYISDVNAVGNIDVSIKKIRIQDIGLSYARLKITVDIDNPSDREISNLEANFKMNIANTYVGDGALSKISIPPYSSKNEDVILTIYYENVARGVVNAITGLDFTLTINGRANVDILFGLLEFSKNFKASKSYP